MFLTGSTMFRPLATTFSRKSRSVTIPVGRLFSFRMIRELILCWAMTWAAS